MSGMAARRRPARSAEAERLLEEGEAERLVE
jgi:hypothetical protein